MLRSVSRRWEIWPENWLLFVTEEKTEFEVNWIHEELEEHTTHRNKLKRTFQQLDFNRSDAKLEKEFSFSLHLIFFYFLKNKIIAVRLIFKVVFYSRFRSLTLSNLLINDDSACFFNSLLEAFSLVSLSE